MVGALDYSNDVTIATKYVRVSSTRVHVFVNKNNYTIWRTPQIIHNSWGAAQPSRVRCDHSLCGIPK